jgi:putative FmdB family regulatory protein
MPVYDYRCTDCGREFIVIESLREHETSKPVCPDCSSANVMRVITPVHLQTGKKT